MLTVITGPMFSGKTTELIRRLRCAQIAGQRILVLKPATDTRSDLELLSHNGVRVPARNVHPKRPEAPPRDVDVLGVDEAQFLSLDWVQALDEAASHGTEVVCACLNQDYLGRPFGIAGSLLARADQVVHLKAVCTGCGTKDGATKTRRVAGGSAQVEIGGSESYRALCRRCWSRRSAVRVGRPGERKRETTLAAQVA